MLTQKKIQKILDELHIEVQFEIDVFDHKAMIVASTLKEKIGMSDMSLLKQVSSLSESVFIFSGRTVASVSFDSKSSFFVVIEGTSKAIRSCCVLISRLIETKLSLSLRRLSREEVLRKILSGQIKGIDIEEALYEHKIDINIPCCVYVIRIPGNLGEKAFEILSKAFPKNQMDFLILMDSQTIALIKAVSEELENNEFVQMAAAIFETIFSEMSIKLCFGIGNLKSSVIYARDSYLEAHRALETGTLYNPQDNIHIYSNLLLERFVNEIPTAISREFLESVFTDEFYKLFNAELQATVQELFDNSLNLSEASRQLYIHRNTLVYRIEKIAKASGLDIRNFHDAVTFRIMMMLNKNL